MKNLILRIMLAASTLLGASTILAQTPTGIPATNPLGTLKQRVGATDVEVTYNRPGAKGRKIFGALVPYGRVWRTGADTATKISFSTPVKFGGSEVPAGTYELFSIPGESEWTVIIHQNKSQWGSYNYDPANDVARATVKPVDLAGPVESFTFSLGDLSTSGATLSLEWDRIRVSVRIETDVVAIVVPQIETLLQGEGRKPYFQAAMFYYENGLDLAKAEEWMTAALAARPGHIGMLHRLALIRAKRGDAAGALAAAQESLEGAQKVGPELRDEYTRLNTALIEKLK